MPAHVACRPAIGPYDPEAGCFVVCPEHGMRRSFGLQHAVAHAACREHNALRHVPQPSPALPITSIIYVSQATRALDESATADLLRRARLRNRTIGVTGMLLTERHGFLQALEGPETAVDALMRSIEEDDRHRHLRVLTRETRPTRRFPDWAMGRGRIGDLTTLPLEHYYEELLMARGALAA